MAIFLGNKEPEWPQLTYATVSAGGGRQPMFPHFGFAFTSYITLYLPGFSDDAAAGSTIKFTYETYGRGVARVDYYNKAGTAITDGVWNGGFTFAEVTDAESIIAYMMDEVDECLYFLAVNTGTSPDQYKLCSVDKEGVVTQSNAWQDPSGTSFDIGAITTYWIWLGSLSRTGAAQDGNFVYVNPVAGIGVDGLAGPHRGAVMTFAESDGALTESNLTDVDTSLVPYAGYDALTVGPTSNNIWWGTTWTNNTGAASNMTGAMGSIVNATTGMGIQKAMAPIPSTYGPRSTDYNRAMPFRWRGYYCMATTQGNYNGPQFYTVDSMHSFVDEMAVKFGIL